MDRASPRLQRAALALAIAVAMAGSVAAQQQKPEAGGAFAFKVAPAQVQALAIQLAALQEPGASRQSFPAQVVAPAGAEQVVSSPVAGLVSQLHVEPLQSVRAGAPLLRVASAELGQLQLQLLQATSREGLARQTAKREQDLLAEGIVARRRVDESQAALREAQAALAQARAALRLAGMGPAAIEKVAASGKPEEGITLTAPRAGVVTQVLAKPGQRVESATALLHIAQAEMLALEIQVPAAEAAKWPVGTRVSVAGGATARVTGVSPAVAANTQTSLLRAAFEGKPASLRQGQLVSVELAGGDGDGFEVPIGTIAREGEEAVVFVRTAEGFEARPVKVVSSSGQRARVAGELKAGQQVAATGIVALKGAWQKAKEAK